MKRQVLVYTNRNTKSPIHDSLTEQELAALLTSENIEGLNIPAKEYPVQIVMKKDMYYDLKAHAIVSSQQV